MTDLLSYQLDEGVATLKMDDGKANAMSPRMLTAINSGLDRALSDQAVVVLTGRPGMFSGGFDLAVMRGERSKQLKMLEAGARLTERMLCFPQPIVVACSGHCIAMGVFIMLSADFRIGVDQGARIHANEVAIGMTLPHFAIEVSRHRLTPAHFGPALSMALPYTPQQGMTAGFLDELASAETLLQVAQARAKSFAALPKNAFEQTKLRVKRPVLEALSRAIEIDIADWKRGALTQSA
jgi:enoyl-CoA hydratase